MNKLYEKDKLTFSLCWIGGYVLLASVADGLSQAVGMDKIATVPALLGMAWALYQWLCRNGLEAEYGLCPFLGNWKDYLWFAPLGLLLTVNLWNGVTWNQPLPETVLFIISMMLVGFLEEVIFRGLLFKALCSNGIRQAFIISSVSFGLGHVVNLMNGAEILPTLLQVFYASTTGFLFTLIFYKSKCLWPCIITHSLFNALSAFAVEPDDFGKVYSALGICLITAAYSLWIARSGDSR